MKEFIIIRHARSCYNINKVADLDSQLTEYGKIQASGDGKFLNKFFNGFPREMWRFYTSPFQRCLMTSKLIAENLKEETKFIVDKRLGEWLDLEHNQSREVFVPSRKKEFNKKFNWSSGYSNYPNEGMTFKSESNADYLNRIYSFLEMNETFGTKAFIVTHGLTALTLIKAITEETNAIPVWDFSIDNASITWIKNRRVIWHGRNLHHEDEAEVQRQVGQ